jgi:hypothetical protein
VTNPGPEIVSGVRVTNVLSSGVAFVSANSTRGTCTHNAGKVTCDIGALTNNTGLTITVLVTAVAEGDLTSSATVTSVEPDLFSPNNTASVTTTVVTDASRTLKIDLVSDGNAVILSWPVSPVIFTLQYLDQFTSSNLWLSMTNVPVIIAARYAITNDASTGTRFYRLRKP